VNEQAPSRRATYLLLAAILALTFAVYAPTLRYAFVYDDHAQLQENPWLRSWQHLPDYFTQRTWAHLPVAATYYRPLFMVWMNANFWLFGEREWAWHLSTVLTHVLATFLAFVLARRLTGDAPTALIAAAIFGLHPAHIEAVAWIAGVTEPLLFVFFAAAWICELKSAQGRSVWLVLSWVLYAAALLMKETAIVLPVLIYAYRLAEARDFRKAAMRVAPFVLVAVAYLALRTHVLHRFAQPLQQVTNLQILLSAPSLLWFYISHLLLPLNLSGFYDLPIVSSCGIKGVLLPSVALMACSLLAVIVARRGRNSPELMAAVVSCLLLVVLPLIPVLNLRVLQQYNFAHDRYLYLPSFGLAVLVAIAVARLPKAKFVLGFAVIALAVGVVLQEGLWHDDGTLYLDGIRNAPGNPVPAANLAAILVRLHRYDDAMKILTPALAKTPDVWALYSNLADCYAGMGDPAKAEGLYLQAYRLYPDYRFLERAAAMHDLALGKRP